MVVYIALHLVSGYAISKEDPFRPPWYKKTKSLANTVTKQKTWYVNQILISGERRIAVVNNIAVKIGDKVSGAQVIDITPSYVALKYNNKVAKYPLMLVHIKKPVTLNMGR